MLTDARIKAAIRDGQAASLSDNTGTRGAGRLVLRIRPRPTGTPAATWLAQHYRDGKRTMQTLGHYPDMSLSAARRAQRDVTPVAVAEQGATLAELSAAYLATLRGRRSHKLASDVMADLLSRIDGKTPANAVTPEQLRAWLADIHGRGAPVMAAASRSVVHAAYGWALRAEQSYTVQADHRWRLDSNPAAKVAPDRTSRRVGQRTLSAEEMAQVYRWASQDKNNAARALMVQILTGCRVEEATKLTADHIDRQRGLITWKATKTGKPHRLPLLDGLRSVLDGIEPNAHGLLFPNPAKPTDPVRLGSLVKVAIRCSRDLDIEHFTPRDLRRSWATVAADNVGIGFEARERVQNHALPGVGEVHYSHAAQYEGMKRDALKKFEDYLLSRVNRNDAK